MTAFILGVSAMIAVGGVGYLDFPFSGILAALLFVGVALFGVSAWYLVVPLVTAAFMDV